MALLFAHVAWGRGAYRICFCSHISRDQGGRSELAIPLIGVANGRRRGFCPGSADRSACRQPSLMAVYLVPTLHIPLPPLGPTAPHAVSYISQSGTGPDRVTTPTACWSRLHRPNRQTCPTLTIRGQPSSNSIAPALLVSRLLVPSSPSEQAIGASPMPRRVFRRPDGGARHAVAPIWWADQIICGGSCNEAVDA